MTKPVIFVVAMDRGFAAGRDQEIHLHAIPCPQCEARFVIAEDRWCKHCVDHQQGETIRGVLFAFGFTWLMAFVGAVYFLTWVGTDPGYAFLFASAIGSWNAWTLSRRVRQLKTNHPGSTVQQYTGEQEA